MRVRSASCRFFRFSRFLLFVSIAPLPKTARQTDNSLALCLRLFERRGDGVRRVNRRRSVRREVARLVPEGRAALGHARVVLLEGPGDEAPRPLRLDELERGPVRTALVGVAALPRLALGILARLLVRAEAPPPAAARLPRELVRQVDLLGQVALLALFVGEAVGDRPRRRDAPRSPAFCSGSRRWRKDASMASWSAPR